MLTRDEVIWGYRYLLGREPESSQVIETHSQRYSDWKKFRTVLLDSAEFKRAQRFRNLPPKWVAAGIFGGKRVLWLDLADAFVSRGCLHDNYEPLETAFVAANLRKGDTFLDIGADIGWFTMLATTLVGDTGHVHAFEPHKPTVDYLRRSVAINGLESVVTVHEVGLDKEERDHRLAWEKKETSNPGHSALVEGHPNDEFETMPIHVTVLDQIGVGKVDFIKIDVEGAEMNVFLGAAKTIEMHRPTILSELYPEQLSRVFHVTPGRLLGHFRSLQYRAFIIDTVHCGEEIEEFPANWPKELLNVALIPEEPLREGRVRIPSLADLKAR